MVYKVKRKSDHKIYALKKVKMQNLTNKGNFKEITVLIFLEKENALNEVRILASINDPYIIQYHEAFYDKELSCLCVIMEFAGGGDLF
jgi:NIMA (never in mitosis gene a)-related kinase